MPLRTALVRLLFGPVGRVIPFDALRLIARPVAWLAWSAGARRDITLKNLSLAFPSLPSAELKRLGRRSLTNLVTVFLEFIGIRHLDEKKLRRVLRVENIELLRSTGPEGALLLSGHFGNWELLAVGAAAIAGIPFSVIVKSQDDGGELDRMRVSRGNRLIPTHRAAREASALLRDGGVVALLADQSADEREHLVSMLGIPTYTFATPARLALRFRPRVIVGFAVRQPDGGYTVRLEELAHDDLDDTPEGAQILTQRYIAMLERAIHEHPEQWVWQHRRWKYTAGVSYD